MDNNKSQLIDLWRTSFNDSEEFIKLFFDRVYKKENAQRVAIKWSPVKIM